MAEFDLKPPATPKPPRLRKFDDPDELRESIYGKVLSTAQQLPPLSNKRHTLTVSGVRYIDPGRFTKQQQKDAILRGQTLSRRLQGTFTLSDNATGQKLDEKQVTLARVPHLTERGTFIHRGSEYTLSHQMRLRPGIFTRVKDNGEIEAHANILPGDGPSQRYYLDPDKSLFYLRLQQAKIPLMPLVRALGATDRQLEDAWGSKLFFENRQKDDPAAFNKLYTRLIRPAQQAGVVDYGSRQQQLRDVFAKMKLDPDVMKRTLGAPYQQMGLDSLLAATKKLIAVSRGEQDVDDRDHLAYQTVMGPEDLFAERLAKDAGGVRRNLLFQSSFKGNLSPVKANALGPQLEAALLHSGLGQALEEINPSELLDKQTKISRMGEGGIPSYDAIPDEARSVQPSHLAFIDPLRSPESFRVGVDLNLAGAVRKGDDGRIYYPFRDPRTGQQSYLSPQDVAEKAITFPRVLAQGGKRVMAMRGGRLGYVKKRDVDYVLPHFEHAFSSLANLIPMKSGVKGQRAVMASRMTTQAVPPTEPQAPLVQAGSPDHADRSYEELFGPHMGAVFAQKPGIVAGVSHHAIDLRHDDGTTTSHELYHNHPFNRKTFLHNTPTVRPGQRVGAGDLLARSNYTDDKGVTALGVNARVGYLPFRGSNFEDAIGISESMARRLSSEHMYQHDAEFDERHRLGKPNYIGIFPSKFSKEQLDPLDDDGVIRSGQPVGYGQPLVVAARQRDQAQNKVHRKLQPGFQDASITWDHHSPGVVTDVVKTPKGVSVLVKSSAPMQVGDKMCFDRGTSLLTRRGWTPVAEITFADELATLNAHTGFMEYQSPTHLWKYGHDGPMYYLNTKHVNMLVTPNHRLWVARPHKSYEAVRADDFFASKGEWQFKKDCRWEGIERKFMEFGEPVRNYASRTKVLRAVMMDDWLEFLGYYLAEGWCSAPGYVKIGQVKNSPHWQSIAGLLKRLELPHRYAETEGRFEIGNVWLYEMLRPLGDAYTKRVPGWLQDLCPRQLRVFLDAYLNGDGHRGNCWEYGSSSQGLAEDIQVICLKLGWSVTVKRTDRGNNWQRSPHWRGRINRSHLRPWWKKSRAKTYKTNQEEMVHYAGDVFCVTVPNHLVYCKREDKTYWSHNSGRYG